MAVGRHFLIGVCFLVFVKTAFAYPVIEKVTAKTLPVGDAHKTSKPAAHAVSMGADDDPTLFERVQRMNNLEYVDQSPATNPKADDAAADSNTGSGSHIKPGFATIPDKAVTGTGTREENLEGVSGDKGTGEGTKLSDILKGQQEVLSEFEEALPDILNAGRRQTETVLEETGIKDEAASREPLKHVAKLPKEFGGEDNKSDGPWAVVEASGDGRLFRADFVKDKRPWDLSSPETAAAGQKAQGSTTKPSSVSPNEPQGRKAETASTTVRTVSPTKASIAGTPEPTTVRVTTTTTTTSPIPWDARQLFLSRKTPEPKPLHPDNMLVFAYPKRPETRIILDDDYNPDSFLGFNSEEHLHWSSYEEDDDSYEPPEPFQKLMNILPDKDTFREIPDKVFKAFGSVYGAFSSLLDQPVRVLIN